MSHCTEDAPEDFSIAIANQPEGAWQKYVDRSKLLTLRENRVFVKPENRRQVFMLEAAILGREDRQKRVQHLLTCAIAVASLFAGWHYQHGKQEDAQAQINDQKARLDVFRKRLSDVENQIHRLEKSVPPLQTAPAAALPSKTNNQPAPAPVK